MLNFSKNLKTELIILTLEKSIENADVVEANGTTIKHIGSYDMQTLFKKIYSDENVDTLMVAKYNQRGAYTSSGGVNEKKISDNYYEDADKLRISYPNTARILKRMGDNFKEESIFERNLELRDFWG